MALQPPYFSPMDSKYTAVDGRVRPMVTFSKIYIHDFRMPLSTRLAFRKRVGPYQWSPLTPGSPRGFYQSMREGLFVDRNGSTFDLRLKYANDLLPSHYRITRTRGYFTGADEDETIRPIVALLPHGRGFLAGWTMGPGMMAGLDAVVYETARDAAMAAHALAENAAERMYESADSETDEASTPDIAGCIAAAVKGTKRKITSFHSPSSDTVFSFLEDELVAVLHTAGLLRFDEGFRAACKLVTAVTFYLKAEPGSMPDLAWHPSSDSVPITARLSDDYKIVGWGPASPAGTRKPRIAPVDAVDGILDSVHPGGPSDLLLAGIILLSEFDWSRTVDDAGHTLRLFISAGGANQ